MRIINWISNNILFVVTLLLLVLIPLYPKVPLIDVKNTWVYIRAEDFIIFIVLLIFLFQLIKNKTSIKTPLTVPILAFWLVGGIATIHGVLLFFPKLANVYSNVAFLSYIRHIEYLSLFFVAFAGMSDKKFLKWVIYVISFVFLFVCLYGLGQKYLGFPAFLTMNEEFAKGIPIQLSSLGRVPSTFAGHYDFAAYIVLIVPILASLIFGIKNKFIKLFFLGLCLLGFLLMFMTVSRVSFAVLLISVFLVFIFQNKKFILLLIPGVLLLILLFTFSSSSLLSRFSNTVNQVDVMVDGKTGAAIGNVEYIPASYLYNKVVKIQGVDNEEKLNNAIRGEIEDKYQLKNPKYFPHLLVSPDTLLPLVKASNISTGETLSQGTGYVNLALSPVKNRVSNFYYEISPNFISSSSAQVVDFRGNFIIKKASAYDLSFTTRFQGEWPNAIAAFMRNIFIGSGYGSVSLAVDNNFLRMLAEVGLMGTFAFISIFLAFMAYLRKNFGSIEDKLTRSFILGFSAGIIGLFLNAILIDVFEASKIAFLLWLLMGITTGVLYLYKTKSINIYNEFKKWSSSFYVIAIFYSLVSIFIFLPSISNFFLIPDFNNFYKAVNCNGLLCQIKDFPSYFKNINIFDSPLSQLYFYYMFKFFWFNQNIYHLVSIFFNLLSALAVFILCRKIIKNTFFSFIAGVLFLLSSGFIYAVISIFSTGLVIASAFTLISLLLLIKWSEKANIYIYIFAYLLFLLSLFLNVVSITLPFLFLLCMLNLKKNKKLKNFLSNPYYLLLLIPSFVFIFERSYKFLSEGNLSISYFVNLPVIILDNLFYFTFAFLLGQNSIKISNFITGKNIYLIIPLFVILLTVALVISRSINKIKNLNHGIIIFSILFILISSFPFIFINHEMPYQGYLASVGIIIFISFMLKTLYFYFLKNGKDVAFGLISVVLIVYVLFNIIKIQSVIMDIYTNGQKVNSFLVSMDGLYSNFWSTDKTKFYFVNVPTDFKSDIGIQESLKSILWFTLQNPNLEVYEVKNLEDAVDKSSIQASSMVFIFEDNGSVKEVELKKNKL